MHIPSACWLDPRIAVRPSPMDGFGSDRNLLIDPSWPGIYGNHSCDPNLWMQDAVTISTRRQIATGEELTIDYALFTANPGWSMPCRCRSRRCRGVVTGDDWRRSDLQVRYRGHFAPFITELIKQQRQLPGPSTSRSSKRR